MRNCNENSFKKITINYTTNQGEGYINATVQRKIFRVGLHSGKTRASMVHTTNVKSCYLFVSKFVMRWRSSTRASLLFQDDWYFISDELCLS